MTDEALIEANLALREELDHLVAAFAKAEANRIEEIANLKTLLAQADKKIAKLQQALREHARHSEGCNAPFGYKCRGSCGYDKMLQDPDYGLLDNVPEPA